MRTMLNSMTLTAVTHSTKRMGRGGAIALAMRRRREAVSFSVPQGEYTILANGAEVCPKGISTLNIASENSLSLQPIEALILLRK